MEQSTTDFFAEYIEEVQSYIPQLRSGIEELQVAPAVGEGFEEVYRLVHSIKGASSMVGVQSLSRIAGYMESSLDEIQEGHLTFSPPLFAAMKETVQTVEQYCQAWLNQTTLDEQHLEQHIREVYAHLPVSQHDVPQAGQSTEEAVPTDTDTVPETAQLPVPAANCATVDVPLSLLIGMITEKRQFAEHSLQAILQTLPPADEGNLDLDLSQPIKNKLKQ